MIFVSVLEIKPGGEYDETLEEKTGEEEYEAEEEEEEGENTEE